MATQKRTKQVFKGILLHTTMIALMLFIAGIDSLYDKGYLFPSIMVIAALLYACFKVTK